MGQEEDLTQPGKVVSLDPGFAPHGQESDCEGCQSVDGSGQQDAEHESLPPRQAFREEIRTRRVHGVGRPTGVHRRMNDRVQGVLRQGNSDGRISRTQ